MTKKAIILTSILTLAVLLTGCGQQTNNGQGGKVPSATSESFPQVVAYAEQGAELFKNSDATFDMVYSSNVSEDDAKKLRAQNSDIVILYFSPFNYIPDSALPIIEAVTGEKITDNFWMKNNEGNRCAYGWTPEGWTVDIKKPENIELMTNFYANVLKYQPWYDGLFFDSLEEKSRCDTTTDSQWVTQSTEFLKSMKDKLGKKIILANSGFNYSESTPYLPYLNGYAMEAVLSGAAGFDEALETVNLVMKKTLKPHYLIYTHYGKDAVTKKKLSSETLRLSLTLSLLHDNTLLHYGKSFEEIVKPTWEDEFAAPLGKPLGAYYKKDNAYFRDFANGTVVSSPDAEVTVTFDTEMTDNTDGTTSNSFTVKKGDGRIFVK